jgi:hypothetical protein
MAQAGIAAVALVLLLGSLMGFGVLVIWIERGAVPAVLLDQPLPVVLWIALSMLLRSFGALAAAIQLFRQRRAGRWIATVVVANDALVTALGPLLGMGAMSGTRWAALALCVAVVAFLWSPPGVEAADR